MIGNERSVVNLNIIFFILPVLYVGILLTFVLGLIGPVIIVGKICICGFTRGSGESDRSFDTRIF